MAINKGRIQGKITIYDKIVLEVMMRSADQMLVTSTANKSINKYFESEGVDPQYGKVVTIFKPSKFRSFEGPEITQWNKINEDSFDMTVQHVNVPIQFGIEELMTDIKALNDRVIKPAIEAIILKQETVAINELKIKTGMFVGSAKTTLTEDHLNTAAAILTTLNAPNGLGDRYGMLSANSGSQLKKSMKTLFNPATSVSQLFNMDKFDFSAYGIHCYESTLLTSHTAGSACNVDEIVVEAQFSRNTIKVGGLVNELNPGDKFVISNPTLGTIKFDSVETGLTNQTLGFSVVSVDKKMNTITFSPSIIGYDEDNLDLNYNASRNMGKDDKLIFAMNAGETAMYNIVYCKYALNYVSFPANKIVEVVKKNGGKASIQTDDKLGESISLWTDTTLTNFSQSTRFDKFFGFKLHDALHSVAIISNSAPVIDDMGDLIAKGVKLKTTK